MIARATVSSPREIHPTSIVSPEARVGRDVTIGPYVVIHANVSLGDGSFVDSHALVGAPTADYYADPQEAFGKTRCFVPWLEAEILPNGDVTPCSDRPDLIVGNVRKEPFKEIWNNDAYRSFRRAMREDGLFPYCSRCCGLWSH